MLKVSADIMNHPLGFVIDGSSSIIKLLFRSKKHYKDGKPLKLMDHGILTLKAFDVKKDFSDLFDFIDDNVDSTLTKEHTDVEWWNIGETSLNFKDQLERRFNIKTRMFPEHLIPKIIIKHYKDLNICMHPASLEGVQMAARIDENVTSLTREIIFQISNENSSPNNYFTQLISTKDHTAWIDKYLAHTNAIETPSLLFQAGSAGTVYKIDESLEIKYIDHLSVCGKTLSASCEELFEEKDFEKILQLAESGNAQKVNVYWKDIKCHEKQDKDFYDVIHADMQFMFKLGKLTSNNSKGKNEYTKADVAAGVVSLMIGMMAKEIVVQALMHQVDRVYACGWLFETSYIRILFQKHLLTESLAAFLTSNKPLKIHFFEEPSLVASKAVWMLNVPQENERKFLKNASPLI